MRRMSLRWQLVWVLVIGVACLPSVFAGPLIDLFANEGLQAWGWKLLNANGDAALGWAGLPGWSNTYWPTGTVLTLTNPSGLPWSLPNGNPSSPGSGWSFTDGNVLLQWAAGAAGGDAGGFAANTTGAKNTLGSYTLSTVSYGSFTGSLNVPVVPEASTLALLSVGLLAGFLFRRRK